MEMLRQWRSPKISGMKSVTFTMYPGRWRQSRGLQKPKTPRPNDSRWSRKKLDEAFRLRVDDRAFWEEKFPGWTLNECVQEVTGAGTLHLIVKMRALPGGAKKKRGKE